MNMHQINMQHLNEVIQTYDTPEKILHLAQQRFGKENQAAQHCIHAALTIAVHAHDGVTRRDGSQYISHPLAVTALFMTLYAECTYHHAAAAILHDVVEDNPGEWWELRIIRTCGIRVAYYVWWVTKQHTVPKKIRRMQYRRRLIRWAPSAMQIMKLCDNLHNLMTLQAMSDAQRRRRVTETRHFYLWLAHKHNFLIHETESALIAHHT